MGINEDIKQVRFSSEYEKAAVNIIYTASWLHAINTNRFKPYAISPQQYNILRIFDDLLAFETLLFELPQHLFP